MELHAVGLVSKELFVITGQTPSNLGSAQLAKDLEQEFSAEQEPPAIVHIPAVAQESARQGAAVPAAAVLPAAVLPNPRPPPPVVAEQHVPLLLDAGAAQGKDDETVPSGIVAMAASDPLTQRQLIQFAVFAIKLAKTDFSSAAYPLCELLLVQTIEDEVQVRARNALARSAIALAESTFIEARSALEEYPPRAAEANSLAVRASNYATACAEALDLQMDTLLVQQQYGASLERLCFFRDSAMALASKAKAIARQAQAAEESAISQPRRENERNDYDMAAIESEQRYAYAEIYQKWDRYQSLQDHLKEGGWEPVRNRGHPVYKRTVVMFAGSDEREICEQTFVMSSTPSDRRAHANALSDLRRRDIGVVEVVPKGFDGSDQFALLDMQLKLTNEAVHELETKRKLIEHELVAKRSRIDELAEEMGKQLSLQ
jgi:hypothetical protein